MFSLFPLCLISVLPCRPTGRQLVAIALFGPEWLLGFAESMKVGDKGSDRLTPAILGVFLAGLSSHLIKMTSGKRWPQLALI